MAGKEVNMMRRIVVAIGVALTAFVAVPAQAEQVCGERAQLMLHLEQQFSEQPIAMGLTAKGAVLEVLTSPSGSWTFLVTEPSGRTCMVASGENWESLPIRPAGQIS